MTGRRRVPKAVEKSLLDAVRMVRIRGPGQFEVAGQPVRVRRDQRTAAGHDVAVRNELANALYAGWYARPDQEGSDSHRHDPGREIGEALRAAHADASRWDGGWTAVRVSSAGRVIAVSDGQERLLDPIDYVATERPGRPPRPGEPVLVVRRRDAIDGGHWIAYGQGWEQSLDTTTQLRLYWNAPATAAAPLVSQLTGLLIEAEVPYSLKALVYASAYSRPDPLVVYVPATRFSEVSAGLRAVHTAMSARLRSGTPALTKRLAKGLGVAEDPGDGTSFGESRCRLVAAALVEASHRGAASARQLLDLVLDHFVAAGVPPGQPHLNRAGSEDYRL